MLFKNCTFKKKIYFIICMAITFDDILSLSDPNTGDNDLPVKLVAIQIITFLNNLTS